MNVMELAMGRDRDSIVERIDRVEQQSFISLYEDAPAELGAGLHKEGPVLVAWLGTYADPGFTSIFDLHLAPDPMATFQRLTGLLRARGAQAMSGGIDLETDPPMDETWLRAQGFTPAYDEWVCWRRLDELSPMDPPAGVEIVPATPDDVETFARVLNLGWGDPEDGALGRAFAAVIGKQDWHHYLALVDGQPGAVAALFVCDGVADCFVAGTAPDARQRGAQTALINRRLIDGQRLGCDIATAQAAADGPSERNYRRAGFQELYSRTVWGRRLVD